MSLTYTDTINSTSSFLVSIFLSSINIKADAGIWMMGPEPGRDFGGVLNRLVEHHPVFDAVYTFKILEEFPVDHHPVVEEKMMLCTLEAVNNYKFRASGSCPEELTSPWEYYV